MVLTLPLPENLGNARLHWRVRQARKKAYWGLLNTLLATGRIPRPPATPIDPARATAHWHVWNRMDDSNAMARLKWIEDWLTAHGYIADDNVEHLRYNWPPRQTIDRRNPRLVLIITKEDRTDGRE